MKPPHAGKFKWLFQSIALGSLLGAILQLIGPEGTVATKKTMDSIHQGAVWNPQQSSAFFVMLPSIVALLALLPRCCRERGGDRLFSVIAAIAAVSLLVYSTVVFFSK